MGILYENRVHDEFSETYGGAYLRSPWIIFDAADRKHRWCQPDALFIDVRRGRIVILEVKYQHCSEAWYQLFQLYTPVVQALFPAASWQIVCCEVVKWYDPHVPTPFPATLRENPLDAIPGKFCVHIWKPK